MFEPVSEDTVRDFSPDLSYIFCYDGAHALGLRTAPSSLLENTQGHLNSCLRGQFFTSAWQRKSKTTFSSALYSSYNVSLCSLIHVFVWNMSCLIKQTIRNNHSTLQKKTRGQTDGRWKVKVEKNKAELVNECKTCG